MTTGRYDLVFIVEAPDDATLVKGLLAQVSKGSIRTETLRAFPEAEYREILGLFRLLPNGGTATLDYRLNEAQGDTAFHREAAFRYANPFLRLANRVLLRHKTAAELAKALQRLKCILETR